MKVVKKSVTFTDTRILSLETQALLLSLCVIICSDTTSLGNMTFYHSHSAF